ncbi:MAG TPA: DUF4190 domain-containing protein [Tepidisphaeraceae bacterium]|nr:DUF4190 domain-containing protein [Tepidisphaeraceae bacterium]
MSQNPVPPVPSALPGGPAYAPPPPSAGMGPARKTNVLAIVSLICGILGCIPFITGLAAIVTGALGIKKANDPQVQSGKGLAIAGIILGVLSVGLWALFGGGMFALVNATAPVRTAGKQFLSDLSQGNVAAAQAQTENLSTEDVTTLVDMVKTWGSLNDVTGFSASINADEGETTAIYGGQAQYANGPHPFVLEMVKVGDGWKVRQAGFDEAARRMKTQQEE